MVFDQAFEGDAWLSDKKRPNMGGLQFSTSKQC
jgi:hypothetical protein